MPVPLEAKKLSRTYGEFRALAETSFSLQPGEIVVLSGPNGAGKSTLLLCLSGLLRPSTGDVIVEGFDLYSSEVEAKKRLAFVPDVPRFYSELTAWEHLQFVALAHGAGAGFEERAGALLTELGLWEARHLYPHKYSRGMRLKLGLALAFIRPLKVLLLDEPTSALDAEGAALLKTRLLALKAEGAAILLSSHDPQAAEELGARRWSMQQGHLWGA